MRPSVVHRSVAVSGALVSVLWLVAVGLVATGAVVAAMASLLVVALVRQAVVRFVRRVAHRDPPRLAIVRTTATLVGPRANRDGQEVLP